MSEMRQDITTDGRNRGTVVHCCLSEYLMYLYLYLQFLITNLSDELA